jgi:hypothetical protein
VGVVKAVNLELFEPTAIQQFEAWKATAGGKHILNLCYRRAACYAARYQRRGRRVSMRLIWESVRDHVSHYDAKLRQKLPAKVNGYRLNDHLAPFVARHIIAHHPEWTGLFEFRESTERKTRKVIVIEESRRAA